MKLKIDNVKKPKNQPNNKTQENQPNKKLNPWLEPQATPPKPKQNPTTKPPLPQKKKIKSKTNPKHPWYRGRGRLYCGVSGLGERLIVFVL